MMSLTFETAFTSLLHLAILYCVPGIARSTFTTRQDARSVNSQVRSERTRQQAGINLVKILCSFVYFVYFMGTNAGTFRKTIPPLAYLRDMGPHIALTLMIHTSIGKALHHLCHLVTSLVSRLEISENIQSSNSIPQQDLPATSYSINTVMTKISLYNVDTYLMTCASLATSFLIAAGANKMHNHVPSFMAAIAGVTHMLLSMRSGQHFSTSTSFRYLVLQTIKFARFILLELVIAFGCLYTLYVANRIIYTDAAQDFFSYMDPPPPSESTNSLGEQISEVDLHFWAILVSWSTIQLLCVPIELIRLAYSYDMAQVGTIDSNKETKSMEEETGRGTEKEELVDGKSSLVFPPPQNSGIGTAVIQLPTYHAALWTLAICLLTGIILADPSSGAMTSLVFDVPPGNYFIFFKMLLFWILATPCVCFTMIASVILRRDSTFRSLWLFEEDQSTYCPPPTSIRHEWSKLMENLTIRSSKHQRRNSYPVAKGRRTHTSL